MTRQDLPAPPATRRSLAAVGLLLVLLCLPRVSAASEDHHDGPAFAPVVSARTEALVGTHEWVMVYAKGALTLYVHRFVDSAPVRGARIEATADFLSAELKEVAPGVYTGTEWTLAPGRNEVTINYAVGAETGEQTLALTLPMAGGSKAAPSTTPASGADSPSGAYLGIMALALYLTVLGLFVIRGRRRPVPQPAGYSAGE